MKLSIIKSLTGLLLTLFVFSAFTFGQILRGKVLDENGKPLVDVNVQPAGYIFSEKTDKDGKFEFKFGSSIKDQKIIIFEKSNFFEVKTVIVEVPLQHFSAIRQNPKKLLRNLIEYLMMLVCNLDCI